MKQHSWPRPPLVLGLVLGDSIERYMFISVERYGFTWMWRPVVAVLLIMSIVGLVRPLIQDIRRQGGLVQYGVELPGAEIPSVATVHHVLHRGHRHAGGGRRCPGTSAPSSCRWWSARIALTVAILSLFNDMCRKPAAARAGGMAEQAQQEVEQKIHMDLTSDTGHLPLRTIVERAVRFFGYLLAFMAVMARDRPHSRPSAIFVIVFMRLEGPERWPLVLTYVRRADPARSTSPSTGSCRCPGRPPCSASLCRR